jgi:hypothetical protein
MLYVVWDGVCSGASGNITRKRVIIQTAGMKEKRCA